ncbi:tRNA guanosine(34) transglycosylase Tgt [Patescibacteria group bacterium]|nr:tRNA guanosine(34) transglycosylase Tgt [Patescibacteria group bacterium]MBU1934027.1 tRNA guanosine(34) transglycosylase Tgt [Patescibacteria group bacterium]
MNNQIFKFQIKMFKIIKQLKNSKARIGKIKTNHGVIKTPFFMPDATRGFVKLIDNQTLNKINVPAMVVNTLHLYLQPGIKIIKKAKGIHNFIAWDKPLLSDSGGFQVFSLIHKNAKMGKITDESVIFKSPIDGSMHELTPEKAIQIQFALKTDMIVCLDDCPANNFKRKDLEKSVERTILWARRCRKEYDKQVKCRKRKPLFFSVIQGGAELDLRKKCVEELVNIDFDGYGFGGMPIDQNGHFAKKVLQFTVDLIPKNSLRFALGIGTPQNIIECFKMGWDMFDCVIPTREARHGKLFNSITNYQLSMTKLNKKFYNTLNINNAKFANDFSPINANSKLPELQKHSKAYLRYLLKLKDPVGQRLASINNLEFYMDLMKNMGKT